jgi:L-ascorbate metabolism protein UlaG (beta-lactamase superfamily)
VTAVRFTHVGGPTVLIEFAGWRLLTDPTFDAPGRRYAFGWGTSSRKLTGPAVAAEEIGAVDAVLLSHDHHGDNLDEAGRALLPAAGAVITTVPAATRLGGRACGLAPWATMRLTAEGRPTIEITATPCRHGPPLSRPVAGTVIGFALRWDGQRSGALWMSGDTVDFRGVQQVSQRVDVGLALLHLGAVRFPITGPVRFSLTARNAVALCAAVDPAVVIPVHYEGWSHFSEGRDVVERELKSASPHIQQKIRWLTPGAATEIIV